MKTLSARQLRMIFLPPGLVLAAVGIAGLFFNVSIPRLTMDPMAAAHFHPLRGCISFLGILLWCGAASACAFSTAVLRREADEEQRRFLFFSSLLSGYLMVDDLFQIHENLAPRYLGLGEHDVYVVLGIAVCAYLIAFRRTIWRTNFLLLALAVGFLGTSVGIDAFLETPLRRVIGDWEYFLEDGTKWLGISMWFAYYADTSLRAVDAAFDAAFDSASFRIAAAPAAIPEAVARPPLAPKPAEAADPRIGPG